ncbi:MAG: 16S rRNA (guanine(966)-N(2))-methyltransferase RsmD [Myxococcota bacterium]|nr:16S rRNA (guanine(966)-N(2))-methyltransferase RsmD [Myxococcota bacterium]
MALRVTGGSLRGRGLGSPRGSAVRPTSSRVRESLFSILGQDLSALHVLDLFAGVGTLGLEAASRGAASVTFVEKDPRHADWIERNSSMLDEEVDCRVMRMDVARGLRILRGQGDRFDLVFLDPPYEGELVRETLESLAEPTDPVLGDGARVVVETATRETLPPVFGRLVQHGRERTYGSTKLTLYRQEEAVA